MNFELIYGIFWISMGFIVWWYNQEMQMDFETNFEIWVLLQEKGNDKTDDLRREQRCRVGSAWRSKCQLALQIDILTYRFDRI